MRIRTKLMTAYGAVAAGYVAVFTIFLLTGDAVARVQAIRSESDRLIADWAEVAGTVGSLGLEDDPASAAAEIRRLAGNFDTAQDRFLVRLATVSRTVSENESLVGPFRSAWRLTASKIDRAAGFAEQAAAARPGTTLARAAFSQPAEPAAVAALTELREFDASRTILSNVALDTQHTLDGEVQRLERFYRSTGYIAIAVLTVSALAAAFMIALGISRRLKGVSDCFFALSRGDFSKPFEWRGHDEFGELSDSITEFLTLLRNRLESTTGALRAIANPPPASEAEAVERAVEQALFLTKSDGAALFPPASSAKAAPLTMGDFPSKVYLSRDADPSTADLARLRTNPGGGESFVRKGDGSEKEGPFIAFPVRMPGSEHAVLSLSRRRGASPYTDLELVFGRQLADFAGLTVENVGAHREALAAEIHKSEMALSSRLQAEMAAPPPPETPGFQMAAKSLAAREIGGDYTEFVQASGGVRTLVLADASGKGVPAALLIGAFRTVLRMFADKFDSAGRCLQILNRALCVCVKPGSFVTATALSFGAADGTVRLAGAGHVETLLYRAADRSVETYGADAMPLGIDPAARFSERSVALNEGDAVLVVSDGVTETRAPDGVEFGIDRLRSFLGSHGELAPDRLVDALEAHLAGFSRAAALHDDRTIAVLRRHG